MPTPKSAFSNVKEPSFPEVRKTPPQKKEQTETKDEDSKEELPHFLAVESLNAHSFDENSHDEFLEERNCMSEIPEPIIEKESTEQEIDI